MAQMGYFNYFKNSRDLWGLKLNYEYLGANSTNKGMIIPQTGSFTTIFGNNNTLTGHVLVDSSQLQTQQEAALLPFIGHAFTKVNVYFGAGPALFNVQSKINRAIGFALQNGVPTDMTGNPANFSKSQWILGAAAQIGLNYFLNSTWYLDCSYTYGISENYNINYAGPFSSTTGAITSTGMAYIHLKQYARTQSFALSINKLF